MDDIHHDLAAIRQIDAIPAILEVIAKATGMGYITVARVTDTRWVACAVLDNIGFGLSAGGELPVKTTLCSEVREHRHEVVIDNVAENLEYAAHNTPALYNLQSYIAVPITLPDGAFFGTLCAIDREPRKPSEALDMFRLFAQLITFHLDAHQKLSDSRADLRDTQADLDNSQFDLAASEAKLVDAQALSELREQFIAILGHDLRNPLAAISAGRGMLEKQHDDPKTVRILRLMGESVHRMAGLIDNVMDFARGRLGDGISVQTTTGQPIEPLLAQVIEEIKTSFPERVIEVRFDLSGTVAVDHSRFAQLFSNLLGNAITHGAEDQAIVVEAAIDDRHFSLAVANGGEPIPPEALDRLFQPFHRGHTRSSLQGLGLGLYIASEIAQAHGGELRVASGPHETRFTFTMPI